MSDDEEATTLTKAIAMDDETPMYKTGAFSGPYSRTPSTPSPGGFPDMDVTPGFLGGRRWTVGTPSFASAGPTPRAPAGSDLRLFMLEKEVPAPQPMRLDKLKEWDS